MLPEDKENFGRKLKKIIGETKLIDGQREPKPDAITGKRMTIWRGIKVKDEWLDKEKLEKQQSLLISRDIEDDNHSSITSLTKNNSETLTADMSERSEQDNISKTGNNDAWAIFHAQNC